MNKKATKRLSYLLFVMISLSFLVSLYVDNYFTYKEKPKIENAALLVNSEESNEVEITEIDKIKKAYNNNDVVGNISISDTNIDEVVFQSSNNSYYLNHNGYKEYDQYGEVFADYRIDFDTSKKILIFGHNSSKIKTPFSNLEKYYDKSYYNNHKYITLTLENEVRTYAIFSVYVETSDWSYMNLKFDSATDWYNHILKLKNKSLYDTGVDVENDDEVLILQTCSYNQNYNDYDKKYLLIISRRVK